MPAFENSSLGKNNAKPIKVVGAKPMKMLLVEDSTLLREVLFETITLPWHGNGEQSGP